MLTILLVGYPILWAIGLGGLWFPLVLPAALVLLRRADQLRPEAKTAVGVGLVLLLSVPAGMVAFDEGLGRALSALGNISVWLVFAAVLSVASLDTLRTLVRGVIGIVVLQGSLTASAYLGIFLPLPLLRGRLEFLPSGIAAFAQSNMLYKDWLDGEALRSAGIMANPTWAGAVGASGVLFAVFLPSRFVRLPVRLLTLAAGATSVYFSLSRSTSVWLYIALGVGLVVLAVRSNQRLFQFTLIFGMVSAFTLAGLNWDRLQEFWDTSNAQRADSLTTRAAIYGATSEVFAEHPLPLIGYGIKPQPEGLGASLATHSSPLSILFRGGYAALFLFVLLVLGLLRAVIKQRSPLGLSIWLLWVGWSLFEDFDGGHLLPVVVAVAVLVAEHNNLPELVRERRHGQESPYHLVSQMELPMAAPSVPR